MTDLSFRTMLIAVGIFITLATVSAILMYYNVAVGVSKIANQRTNTELEYSKTIDLLLEKDILTGTDVRNIIRHYYLDPMVVINIVSINKIATVLFSDAEKYKDFGGADTYKNVNNTWKSPNTKVISEYNMERINPSYSCKIRQNTSADEQNIKTEYGVNVKLIQIELN